MLKVTCNCHLVVITMLCCPVLEVVARGERTLLVTSDRMRKYGVEKGVPFGNWCSLWRGGVSLPRKSSKNYYPGSGA